MLFREEFANTLIKVDVHVLFRYLLAQFQWQILHFYAVW